MSRLSIATDKDKRSYEIFSLNQVSGSLKNGQRSDFWLRSTVCFRKIDGDWFIVHDQVSVPADFESGRAAFDLEP